MARVPVTENEVSVAIKAALKKYHSYLIVTADDDGNVLEIHESVRGHKNASDRVRELLAAGHPRIDMISTISKRFVTWLIQKGHNMYGFILGIFWTLMMGILVKMAHLNGGNYAFFIYSFLVGGVTVFLYHVYADVRRRENPRIRQESELSSSLRTPPLWSATRVGVSFSGSPGSPAISDMLSLSPRISDTSGSMLLERDRRTDIPRPSSEIYERLLDQ